MAPEGGLIPTFLPRIVSDSIGPPKCLQCYQSECIDEVTKSFAQLIPFNLTTKQ